MGEQSNGGGDYSMSNFDEIFKNIKETQEKLKKAAKESEKMAAEKILEASQENVPVLSGNLKSSGTIKESEDSTSVEYTAPYAIDVHENQTSQGYKFLEQAAMETDSFQIMKEEIKKALK